ncbi:hypothetical protein DICPUDRAFT_84439 [Dictyostelium purpureum]|uniref:EGF-like domain-containing protein n=1 Tax=Dictyostelium purpureum TaxID=5786 RepID=F1A2M9_DICPU|nr:uncharacterized protein DICPUDRAFT_84439 [Dictyostelium purpureum]EGC29555.1 hypothetical protein DICPUDRAFT_84439 [Dictyostelium purpureum]|eukprot:XP_003293925.1 hypothetical protein DICPUDRAFT_84439 [Dictyostelium purpureum]
MKVKLFLFIILTFLCSKGVVKSDELNCLALIFLNLFQTPITETNILCTGNLLINKNGYSYESYCEDGINLTELFIRSIPQNGLSGPSVGYSDLNCFLQLSKLELTNILIQPDAFGKYNEKKVANRLHLYNNTFVEGRISSASNSISQTTEFIVMTYNKNSNLLFLDLREIKNLKFFQLLCRDTLTNYPVIENTIDPLDTSIIFFSNLYIATNMVPSLSNIKCENVFIQLVNAGSTISWSNFDTFQSVRSLNLYYDDDIFYPTSLANSGIKVLSLGGVADASPVGLLKAPSIKLPLPPQLETLSIANSPDFNVNGDLPFSEYPNTLDYISFGNLGIKNFPLYLPSNIVRLLILGNNFAINGPVSLPDLSMYSALYYLNLVDCGYTSTIPESYGKYRVRLNDNDISGYWPQWAVCYKEEYDECFDNNPKLIQGTCEPGSIVPNVLEYNILSGILKLTGKNLGINGPVLKDSGKQFTVEVAQSSYYLDWDSNNLGPLPETLQIYFGYHEFAVATKVFIPNFEIQAITKLGKRYIFTGINFSNVKSDFKILVSGIQATIYYIDFNKIEIEFNSQEPLPLGQDIPATIQNVITNQIIKFTINTLDDKTTNVLSCASDCGSDTGLGKCSSSTGKCICLTPNYGGDQCKAITQFLSSASSTPTEGGLVNLYGWFGDSNSNFNVKIGSSDCLYHFVNSTFSNCTIGPGFGTHSVTIFQNGFTWVGQNMFHFDEITFKCPKNCSSNGQCIKSKGQCKCYSGWGGYDCNSKTSSDSSTTGGSTTTTTGGGSYETPSPTPSPIEIPKSNITINETVGSTVISNQQTEYEISILSLVELDILDNIVIIHNLTNSWRYAEINSSNTYKFKQTIQEVCTITYTIEDIKASRDYEFAGLELTLEKDSIKITITIENYPFTSALNKLQLRLISSVGDNKESSHQSNNECNNQNTEIDSSQIDKDQLLNYVTISKNQKLLYGRFINRVLSDTRKSFITTSLISATNSSNKDSFIIGLNLPHFTTSLTIDPDFSVLVSSSYKKCNSNDTVKRASWVLPVAIVVPCVAVATLVIVGAVLYSKNRTKILLAKNKYKFTFELKAKNKDDL